MSRILTAVVILLLSANVHAYLGPGMAGGVLASVLAFLAAILIGFGAILYYPIKRAIKTEKEDECEVDGDD